jgi:hypothetical protein
MLINNDVQSSQAAHRQRRLAADEKLRADRTSHEAAVREGAVRQAGEAPTRDEVAQFRGLMQGARTERAADAGKPPSDQMQTAIPGEQAPKFDGELAGLSTADRFRTLMQRAFAQVGDQGANEAAKGEQPAPTPRETRAAEPERREAAPTSASAQNSDAQRSAAAERQRPATTGAEAPVPRDGTKPAAKDGASVDAKPSAGEHKRSADSGDAESAQTLARKAADGEAQVGAAARSARSSGGSEDGEGMEAGTAQAGPGSTPTPMPTEMAAAPTQPQTMTAAPQQAAAASTSLAPALAELVQKHVRQMLVSDPRSGRGGSREVLLRMQNDVLPGTDLWLTQTENGWQLRADVRSRDAYDTLLANQDELVQRFADGALGKLTIEPVFHG